MITAPPEQPDKTEPKIKKLLTALSPVDKLSISLAIISILIGSVSLVFSLLLDSSSNWYVPSIIIFLFTVILGVVIISIVLISLNKANASITSSSNSIEAVEKEIKSINAALNSNIESISQKFENMERDIIEYHNYSTYGTQITIKRNRKIVELEEIPADVMNHDGVAKINATIKHDMLICNESGLQKYEYLYDFRSSEGMPPLAKYEVEINKKREENEDLEKKFNSYTTSYIDGTGKQTFTHGCTFRFSLAAGDNSVNITEKDSPSFSNLNSFAGREISASEHIGLMIYYPTDYLEIVIDGRKLTNYSIHIRNTADCCEVLDKSEQRVDTHIKELKKWGAIPSSEENQSLVRWRINCPIIGYRYRLEFALKKK